MCSSMHNVAACLHLAQTLASIQWPSWRPTEEQYRDGFERFLSEQVLWVLYDWPLATGHSCFTC